MELIPYNGNFIGIVHPSIMADIRREAAKAAWYHRRHVERWERRYGKPYPEITCETGVFRGVSFIE